MNPQSDYTKAVPIEREEPQKETALNHEQLRTSSKVPLNHKRVVNSKNSPTTPRISSKAAGNKHRRHRAVPGHTKSRLHAKSAWIPFTDGWEWNSTQAIVYYVCIVVLVLIIMNRKKIKPLTSRITNTLSDQTASSLDI